MSIHTDDEPSVRFRFRAVKTGGLSTATLDALREKVRLGLITLPPKTEEVQEVGVCPTCTFPKTGKHECRE